MKSRILALVTTVVLVLDVCGSSTPIVNTSTSDAADNGLSGAAGPGTTKVSATLYLLEYAATGVSGNKASIMSLTLPDQEPYDLELTSQQVVSLEEAGLVVYLKGFRPAIDEAVEQSGAKNKSGLSQMIQLHSATEDHDHDVGGTEDHNHETTSPHFWLDPALKAKAVSVITDELSKINANNRSTYEMNAKSTTDDLTALGGECRSGLTNCRIKAIITTHAAFGYLTERYGLEQVGISGLSPNEQPSPACIAKVQEEAKEHGVTTTFFETLTSDEVVRAITDDLGLRTAVLDPIEGITAKSAGQDYPSVMEANLDAIKQTNGCF